MRVSVDGKDRPRSEEYNAFLRMQRDFASGKQQNKFTAGDRTIEQADSNTFAWVLNATGAHLLHGQIVGLDFDANMIDPAYDGWHEVLLLRGELPSSADHTGCFGVTQEPIPAGKIGKVCVAGATRCRLNVIAEGDTTAEVTDASSAYLTTSTSGSARILYKQTGTGAKWGIVRLGQPPAATRVLTEWYNPATLETSLSGGRFSQSDNAYLYFGTRIGAADNGVTHNPSEATPSTNGNFTVTETGLYQVAMYWRVAMDPTTWGAATGSNDYGYCRLMLRRKPSGGAFATLDNGNIWGGSDFPQGGPYADVGVHISASNTFLVNLDEDDVLNLLCSGFSLPTTLEWTVNEAKISFERLGNKIAEVTIP